MEFRRIAVCYDCLAAFRSFNDIKHVRNATPAASLSAWKAPRSRRWQNSRAASQAIDRRAIRPQRVQDQQQDIRRAAPVSPPPFPSKVTSSDDLKAIHNRVLELSSSVLRPSDTQIPPEQRVLYVLEQLDALARNLVDARSIAGSFASQRDQESQTATSALLGSVNARKQPADVSKGLLLNLISVEAEQIVQHPHIFISPSVLKAYVDLQTLLYRPSSFPAVFDLYARKPVPNLSGDEIAFSTPSPDKINAAIASSTATTALNAAITAHDLPLAIDIIDTSFSTPAFRKAKILRQALVPIAGVGIAPLAAYTLSTQFSNWQQTMDPSYAAGIAFAGIITYIASVSSIGYVAVTTANDQMDRVVWAQGVPLWERWVREEERAAIDKLAGAWGFQSLEKRGEEEGEEWESLREFVGMRGMVLDKVELMEGME